VGEQEDATSRIYGIIRDYAASRQITTVELSSIEPMILKKGLTRDQLDVCLLNACSAVAHASFLLADLLGFILGNQRLAGE
jgi:hypothetical protein